MLRKALFERSDQWMLNWYMAVGQNQWYHFGVGPPPILVYFNGDWDVHWGCVILTHGHIAGSTETHSD